MAGWPSFESFFHLIYCKRAQPGSCSLRITSENYEVARGGQYQSSAEAKTLFKVLLMAVHVGCLSGPFHRDRQHELCSTSPLLVARFLPVGGLRKYAIRPPFQETLSEPAPTFHPPSCCRRSSDLPSKSSVSKGVVLEGSMRDSHHPILKCMMRLNISPPVPGPGVWGAVRGPLEGAR